MFIAVKKKKNNRKYLGFVKSSECHMAGNFCYHEACASLAHLAITYFDPRLSAPQEAPNCCNGPFKLSSMGFLFLNAKAFYPFMHIVCLADMIDPAIAKLNYYVFQDDRIIIKTN